MPSGRACAHPAQPELLVVSTIQPIMFVVLFRYVLGGAIKLPGVHLRRLPDGRDFVQHIAFGGVRDRVGLTEDSSKGLIDRFRSLPMSRARGARRPHALGRRAERSVDHDPADHREYHRVPFHSTFGDAVAGVALLLLFGYSFSWVLAFIGLVAKSSETVNSVGFITCSR